MEGSQKKAEVDAAAPEIDEEPGNLQKPSTESDAALPTVAGAKEALLDEISAWKSKSQAEQLLENEQHFLVLVMMILFILSAFSIQHSDSVL